MAVDRRHVMHLVYRFSVGGLENMVVQLVNRLPESRFRHTIVALTEIDEDFAGRVPSRDVRYFSFRKPPGQSFRLFPQFLRLLRTERPDTLHTCNLASLEFQAVAWLAGVPCRVHAEHGWDVSDPDGTNRRHRLLRRALLPFVHECIAVSPDIRRYLVEQVGFASERVHTIANGVDLHRFRPRLPSDQIPEGFPFDPRQHWIIGTIGRMETIKNQVLLAQAFVRLTRSAWPKAEHLRLVMVGDGQLREQVMRALADAGLGDRAWIPGSRDDIPNILRALNCFVLPSLAEGTSCTLQEAMSSALPIVATDVGGTGALLEGGRLGILVRSRDPDALAEGIRASLDGPAVNHVAREAMTQHYDLARAVVEYDELFWPPAN